MKVDPFSCLAQYTIVTRTYRCVRKESRECAQSSEYTKHVSPHLGVHNASPPTELGVPRIELQDRTRTRGKVLSHNFIPAVQYFHVALM